MANGGGQYSDEYIQRTLIEEHRKNVFPQKQFADLVVDATKPSEDIITEVLLFITKPE